MKTNDECAIDVARIVNFNAQSMICAHARGTDACNVKLAFCILITSNYIFFVKIVFRVIRVRLFEYQNIISVINFNGMPLGGPLFIETNPNRYELIGVVVSENYVNLCKLIT